MKAPIPTLLNIPSFQVKPNPSKRLSLAVRELDKLINRANQLGKLPLQVLNKDQIGKPIPLSETNPTQPISSDS
jgi:hypothetical protein